MLYKCQCTWISPYATHSLHCLLVASSKFLRTKRLLAQKENMGKIFKKYLIGPGIYSCSICGTHLTLQEELISTNFRGRTGTAWLFKKVHNVSKGQLEDRLMTTGRHTIVDVYCNDCGTNLGWKYVEAEDEGQKYKKGRYILEKALFMSVDKDNDASEVSERRRRVNSVGTSEDDS